TGMVTRYLRSAPAGKAGLAEGITAPLLASSVATFSIAAIRSTMKSGDTTFIGLLGSFSGLRATPSASTARLRVLILLVLSALFQAALFQAAGERTLAPADKVQTRSMMVAVPRPLPAHSVISAVLRS